MAKRWTKEEELILREGYGQVSSIELARRLNRSPKAVKRKASYLGLTETTKPWTEQEKLFVRENYKNMTYLEMSEKLGRTHSDVKNQGRKMGINKRKYTSDSSLKGQKFNRLLVIERVYKEQRYWWKCRCDCGNITLVETNHLKNGIVKSCGCYKKEYKITVKLGDIYGRWVVLAKTKKRDGGGSVMWLCECKCGNTKEVSGNSLREGASRSCGCIRKEILQSKTGERNHNYKAFLTKEDRLQRRYMLGGTSIDKVREKVYKRDDYTCVSCQVRGGDLNSHHLNSWNTYPSGRFDVSNCVTLCVACHRNFHKKYGYGDNTKEQFEEYLKTLD